MGKIKSMPKFLQQKHKQSQKQNWGLKIATF